MALQTISRIHWPRPSLSGCIFCVIQRDTRGVDLDPLERFNFFPASPLCCVTGVLSGNLHLISGPEEMEKPWSAPKISHLSFSGAQLGPLVSWSPGEVFCYVIAFYPDAFSAMAGIDLSGYSGRMEPAENTVPSKIVQPCQRFFERLQIGSTEDALSRFEDEIEPMWSERRGEAAGPARWLKDWTRSLAGKAVISGAGKSARQVARRIRSWTGVNERELKTLGHTEQLYARIHAAAERGELDWAEMAVEAGFADQAHMIRRMRKHTGFTPETLRERTRHDEAFWGYRLLGEYFSRPDFNRE